MKNRKKQIKAVSNILKNKKWMVAFMYNEVIVYNKDDIEKVIDNNGFIAPCNIAKFTTLEKAMRFAQSFSIGIDYADSEDCTGWIYEY